MKNKIFFTTSIFILSTQLVLAQSASEQLGFPNKINFSEAEIKYLKALPSTSLQKLINIAKFGSQNNGTTTVSTTTKLVPQQPAVLPPQTPLAGLVNGLQKPPSNSDPFLPRDLNGLGPMMNGENLPRSVSSQPDIPVKDQTITQSFDDEKFKKAFSSEELAKCPNYGIKLGGSCPNINCLSPKLKLDLTKLCTLTKKILVVDSGHRSRRCNPGGTGSQHILGKAIDTDFTGWSQEEKVIGTLYFLSRCYNGFGVYGANHNVHFDHRTAGPMLTYAGGTMRWGRDYSHRTCTSTGAPQYILKAFQLMGIDRCAVPDRMTVINAAKAALKKLGKENFIPEGTTEAQICAGYEQFSCNG